MATYHAGNYTADKAIDVVKKMDYKSNKGINGVVTKVFGVWATEDNTYKFRPGQVVSLTKEDLENANLQSLIDNGMIRRVL